MCQIGNQREIRKYCTLTCAQHKFELPLSISTQKFLWIHTALLRESQLVKSAGVQLQTEGQLYSYVWVFHCVRGQYPNPSHVQGLALYQMKCKRNTVYQDLWDTLKMVLERNNHIRKQECFQRCFQLLFNRLEKGEQITSEMNRKKKTIAEKKSVK